MVLRIVEFNSVSFIQCGNISNLSYQVQVSELVAAEAAAVATPFKTVAMHIEMCMGKGRLHVFRLQTGFAIKPFPHFAGRYCSEARN